MLRAPERPPPDPAPGLAPPPPAFPSRRRPGRGRRLLGRSLALFGRAAIVFGLLVALFAAFELWGTRLIAARQQQNLAAELDHALDRPPRTGVSSGDGERPHLGDAVARIAIPQLGLKQAVVEGVDVADLRKGPGHYPETVLPGHRGNAAIAGHRTTYGAPFRRLDDLQRGDRIRVTTTEGRFTYRVTSSRIVDPSDVSVLAPATKPVLTLTTCHPEYSARQRLVVQARLVTPTPTSLPPEPTPAIGAGATFAGAGEGMGGTEVAVLAAPVAVGLAWWWAWRRRRRWTTWVAGGAVFLAALLPAFVQLEHLMPAGV